LSVIKDLTGQRFGKLAVLERAPNDLADYLITMHPQVLLQRLAVQGLLRSEEE